MMLISTISSQTEKYDAKPTYKKFHDYRLAWQINRNDLIVGIENSDGNTNVRFHQKDTLKNSLRDLVTERTLVNRLRADPWIMFEIVEK